MRTFYTATLSLITVLLSLVSTADTGTVFILDGSGSMWGQVEGRPKIEIARQVMVDLSERLPENVQTGLMVYGHNRKDDCDDIETLVHLGGDRAAMNEALQSVRPKGMTPITASLHRAVDELKEREGQTSIVIVSDGKETCGGDPCSAAREAIATGINLRIHVIGFDVTPEETRQLTCIAEEGNGKYFEAANTDQLTVALAEVEKEVVAEPAPPPEPTETVLFQDTFDRDDLGTDWSLTEPDENRFMLIDGKALSVATTPEANRMVLQQPLSGDFKVSVSATMKLERNNSLRLYTGFGEDNYVVLRLDGNHGGAAKITSNFVKWTGGKSNEINTYRTLSQVGERDLEEAHGVEHLWYLQIQRSGLKFTGRISADGTEWVDVGEHTLLGRGDLQVGISAFSSGVENAAYFDDFVIKSVQ